MDSAVTRTTARTIFDQPRGLRALILAELWERFGFYGMRSLLVLYLIDHVGLSGGNAATLYGSFAAIAFGMSIPGGLLADRIFGTRYLTAIGGCLVLIGHVLMVVQDILDPGAVGGAGLLLALACIATGTGLFKPAISARVGALYAPGDMRREAGFYLFYVGINAGAALAPLLCGYLGQTFGWRYGFAAAGCAMAVGLVTLTTVNTAEAVSGPRHTGGKLIAATLGVPVLLTVCTYGLLRHPDAVGWLLGLILAGGVGALARYMAVSADREERRRLLAALALIIAAAVFWSLHEQGGSILNVLAAKAMDLSVGPFTLRPSQTQVFNALFILMGAPLFAALWRRLRARGADPAPPYKFAIGLALAAAAFALLATGTFLTSTAAKMPLIWLVLAYMLETMGELCLATPGYATMARLSPPKVSGLVMGLWLFSLSAGNFIGGKIAASALRDGADPAALATYTPTFASVAVYGAVAALLVLVLARPLARIINTAR